MEIFLKIEILIDNNNSSLQQKTSILQLELTSPAALAWSLLKATSLPMARADSCMFMHCVVVTMVKPHVSLL